MGKDNFKNIFIVKGINLKKMIAGYCFTIGGRKFKPEEYEAETLNEAKKKDFYIKMSEFKNKYKVDLSKYEDGNNSINLPYELADLYSLMVALTDKKYIDDITESIPFYEDSINILTYNKKVINAIAKLPEPIRKYIRSKRKYKYGYTLIKYMDLILERIGVLTVSIVDSDYISNSGRIFPMRETTNDTIIDDLDNFIDKFSLVDYWHEYGSNLKIESKYLYKLLEEVFEEFIKYEFSNTYKEKINLLYEKYKKEIKSNKSNNNAEIEEKYKIGYLELFEKESGINNYRNTTEVVKIIAQNEKNLEYKEIDKLQMYKVKRMFPYIYKYFLTDDDKFIPNELKNLEYNKPIIAKIRNQFNICMSVVREQLYLSVIINIICECTLNPEAKNFTLKLGSEEYIFKLECFTLLIKFSFYKLCKLGEHIAKSDSDNISSFPTYYKLESIFNDDNFNWESMFNAEQSNRFECRNHINKLLESVPFIRYLHNPLIEREDFNSDLNDEYKKPYLKEVDEYSQKIAKNILEKIKKNNSWEEFSDITTKLIIRYSKKLFEEYIKKEQYKSDKYYKYKERYDKKIADDIDTMIGKIFVNIAEEEMKRI